MSARTQHLPHLACSSFASAPCFGHGFQTGNFASTAGSAFAQAIAPLEAADGKFTSYPPQHKADADEELVHTYASFREEPVTALAVNTRQHDNWTLAIRLPVPKLNNPTLLAVEYMIKYATTCENGNSTIQTDLVLTTQSIPEGIIIDSTDLVVYQNKTGYAPRMVDHDLALRLSSVLAVKANGGSDQWSHYADNGRATPNVRVLDDAHLYLLVHVNEYPTVHTLRSLAVEASATWQKEEVELKAKAAAEKKRKEEEDKKAKEEAEKKAREEEERQARREEKQAREEERQARAAEEREREENRQARAEQKIARDEERQARLEEKQFREEETKARLKAAKLTTISAAPDVADQDLQDKIGATLERLGIEKCANGLAYVKKSWGYECTGGSHKITFAQLGMQ